MEYRPVINSKTAAVLTTALEHSLATLSMPQSEQMLILKFLNVIREKIWVEDRLRQLTEQRSIVNRLQQAVDETEVSDSAS